MKRKIRVGTRDSCLAMTQTNLVIEGIRKKHPELDFETVAIKTKGDILLDVRLDKVGGKGLFIKELENAMLDGRIDIAVHSLKDMPAELPDGLCIAAVSQREDPRDVLVTTGNIKLDALPDGAIVGTSSIRRELQLSELKRGLQFKNLRGNVLSRLNKLTAGEYDGIILAAAGLKRLGMEEKCRQYFSVEEMIPAVGQGILAIEARKDDDTAYLMDSIHCSEAALAASAERAYMIRLNGGCTTPMAAHAIIQGDSMKIFGMLALEDKSLVCRAQAEGKKQEAERLGVMLADMILEKMEQEEHKCRERFI